MSPLGQSVAKNNGFAALPDSLLARNNLFIDKIAVDSDDSVRPIVGIVGVGSSSASPRLQSTISLFHERYLNPLWNPLWTPF